ncbi:hypothetical protein ACFLRQ_02730 [Bacteroidota bacterium]
MKKVNAFKCAHCKKIYELKSSCRSHEYRCYHNPKTTSCATCVFLWMDSAEIDKDQIAYQVCLANRNISSGKLHYSCNLHCSSHVKFDEISFNEVAKHYDYESALRRELEFIRPIMNKEEI